MTNTIEYDVMLRIVEMMEHRGYESPVLYVVPTIPQNLGASKKKGKAKEIPKNYYSSEHTIFGTDILDDEESYNEDFRDLFLTSAILIGEDNGNDETPTNLVLLHPNNDTNLSSVREAITNTFNLTNEGVKIVLTIIISRDYLSAPAMKELSKPSIYKLQHFTLEEIQFPNCIFLPKYEQLTPEEIKALYADLDIKNGKDLPKALTGDPTIKYHGFEQGTVLRIRRQNIGLPTVIGNTIGYAIVVAGNPMYRRKDKKEEAI